MGKDIFWTSLTFSVLLGLMLLASWPQSKNEVVIVYDCRISDVSPDYPVAVKELCQKRNSK